MEDEILAWIQDSAEVADGIEINLAVGQLSSEWRAGHQNRSISEKLPCFKPGRTVVTLKWFRLGGTRAVSNEGSPGRAVGRPSITVLRGIALDYHSRAIAIHRDD